MRRGLKTRGNRFCSAYNYSQNYVRGAYLSDMARQEYMNHCFELDRTGKTVVDGWLILRCQDCGTAYPDTEEHHCLKLRLVKFNLRTDRLCKWCGTPFTVSSSQKKYCCQECADKAIRARKSKDRKKHSA